MAEMKDIQIKLPSPNFDIAAMKSLEAAQELVVDMNDGNFHEGEDLRVIQISFIDMKINVPAFWSRKEDLEYVYNFIAEISK